MNTRQDLLKIVAMVTMLMDHLGVIFFPEVDWLRTIGRLAFPLFAYFIAQGFRYTRSRPRYFLRLLVFGLISQVPYVFLNEEVTANLWQVNQVPLLLYAALVLVVLEQGKTSPKAWARPLWVIAALGLALLPDILMFYLDELQLGYGGYGILLSLLFWWFDDRWPELAIGFIALSWFYPYRYFAQWANPTSSFIPAWLNLKENLAFYRLYEPWWTFSGIWNQNNALWALPIIYLAKQWPSDLRLNKWITYWFYPGHIAALVIMYHLFVK